MRITLRLGAVALVAVRLGAFVSISLFLLVTSTPPLPLANAKLLANAVPLAQTGSLIGPLDVSGEIHGAPYRIRVPENWNGTLLVFAHGYRDKADHPSELENRNPDLAPSPALVAPLLAQGYALAGSAFKE